MRLICLFVVCFISVGANNEPKGEMENSDAELQERRQDEIDLCSMTLAYDSTSTDSAEEAPVQHYSSPLLEPVPDLDGSLSADHLSEGLSADFSALKTDSSLSRTNHSNLPSSSQPGAISSSLPQRHPFAFNRYSNDQPQLQPSTSAVHDPQRTIDTQLLPSLSTFAEQSIKAQHQSDMQSIDQPSTSSGYQGNNQMLLMEFIFNSALDAQNAAWIQWTGDGSDGNELQFTIDLNEAAKQWNFYKKKKESKDPARDFAHQIRNFYGKKVELTGIADYTYRFYREAVEEWYPYDLARLLAMIVALKQSYTMPTQLKKTNKKKEDKGEK